jgi:FkbM family methyltransferase
MTFISYAQNFEDVMLWRALKHVEQGFYVDIGAQHPVTDSVSLVFYEHGWKGVHIEPSPRYAGLLREHRPDEVVIQAAIGTKSEELTFYEIPETGLSTADEAIARRHQNDGFSVRNIVVPSLTLDEALAPFAGREIHWLKIDVEGYERQVIEGWETKSIKPWIVMIESTLPLSQTMSNEEWEPMVLSKGYQFAYFDGLNRFFVSSDHPELMDAFKSGPNVFDDFALSGEASTPFCALLNDKIQQAEARVQQAENQLAAIYASSSWRLTRPLRGLKQIIRKTLGRI